MTGILGRLDQDRVRLYSFLIIFAAAIGFLWSARIFGIFACQSPDNPAEEYLAYCNVTNYGDYDHGAFWHGLEPSAIAAAKSAKILFVGNSRMQFALSTDEVDAWFSSERHSYFLLGFSHNESYRFFWPLLKALQPEARVIILNVDDLFADKLTGPANDVMYEHESFNRYTQKRHWQRVHSTICGSLAILCGNKMSFIRKRGNGAWTFSGADFMSEAALDDRLVSYDPSISPDRVESYVARARDLLDDLPDGAECVVLMNTPGSGSSAGTVAAVAEALELPLVAPYLDGLRTFDGSHLDVDSASRWSSLFMGELAPHIQRCLG